MTPLERLALAVSARLSGDDLVLVLDYAAELERHTRQDERARYVEITHGAYAGLYRRSAE